MVGGRVDHLHEKCQTQQCFASSGGGVLGKMCGAVDKVCGVLNGAVEGGYDCRLR